MNVTVALLRALGRGGRGGGDGSGGQQVPLLQQVDHPQGLGRVALHSESGCLSPPATRLQIKSNEGESSMMGHGSSFHHPHVSPQKSNFLLLTPGNYSSSLILFHVSFFFVDGLHSLFFLLIYFNKKHFFFSPDDFPPVGNSIFNAIIKRDYVRFIFLPIPVDK